MAQVSMAYFSQTGTTKIIADEICHGVLASGGRAFAAPMASALDGGFSDHEILGFGFPVYMFRPPFHVADFIQGLPDLSGKAFFLFVLYGTHPGSTAKVVRKMLLKKGARDLGVFYSTGEDLFAGYLKEKILFSHDCPKKGEKERARAFGASLLEKWAAKDFKPPADSNRASLPDLIERAGTHRFFARHLYRRMIAPDPDLCNGCGLCESLCPTGNITMEGGIPKLGTSCLLCLTCELRCPKGAFSSPFTSWVFAPAMKFNVWQGKRKNVPYKEVLWEKGRVKRL